MMDDVSQGNHKKQAVESSDNRRLPRSVLRSDNIDVLEVPSRGGDIDSFCCGSDAVGYLIDQCMFPPSPG